jgi:hypothetical protein
MSKVKIYKYDELDINNIDYNEPVKNGRSYTCKLSCFNDIKNNVYIQTPVLKCVSQKDIMKSGFINLEVPMNQLSFYIWFQNLDKMTINKAHINSLKWFNKNIPKEIIEDYYKTFISNKHKLKNEKNTKYVITCKLPFENDIVQCKCYNESNTEIDIGDIQKGMNVALILNIDKLIFKKQEFYLDVKISQIKVYKELYDKYKHITEKCVIEDPDSDDDFDKSMVFDDFDNKEDEQSDIVKVAEAVKVEEAEAPDPETVKEPEPEPDPELDKESLKTELSKLKEVREQSNKDLERMKQLVLEKELEYKELERKLQD